MGRIAPQGDKVVLLFASTERTIAFLEKYRSITSPGGRSYYLFTYPTATDCQPKPHHRKGDYGAVNCEFNKLCIYSKTPGFDGYVDVINALKHTIQSQLGQNVKILAPYSFTLHKN
jgi:hypothetical protein